MHIKQKFQSFFNNILEIFSNKQIEDNSTTEVEEVTNLIETEILKGSNEKERISVKKRTLLTRLYTLEQKIKIFEDDFTEKYNHFSKRIEKLRETYNISLNEIKNPLTFDIDPEIDGYKIGEVVKLEREIQYFLETEVKFNIIERRIQQLIVKINILYNVSIFHFDISEKKKVNSQIEKAKNVLIELVNEFKSSEYILYDIQLKERFISLISYADYLIFKTQIRNTNKIPDELIKEIVMIIEFDEFNYKSTFRDYIIAEISNLEKLNSLIDNKEIYKILTKKSKKILTELSYSNNLENQILNSNFWNNFLDFESTLFEILKANGIPKEQIKVSIIDEKNIKVTEKEVIVIPKDFAYISLISLFSTTNDEKLLVIIKLLNSLSNDVTYKEIYFLALLFDTIETIKDTPNELLKYIEKYLNKYPYNQNTIKQKKESVIKSANKDYIFVFSIADYENQITEILKKLNIDFKIIDNKIYINSFYFNGLNNVLSSLKTSSYN